MTNYMDTVMAEHVLSYADLVASGHADTDLVAEDRAETATLLRMTADMLTAYDMPNVSRHRWATSLARVASLRESTGPAYIRASVILEGI